MSTTPHSAASAHNPARQTTSTWLRLTARAVMVTTVVAALNVFVLFISAGQIVGAGASDTVHEFAAVALHVTTAAAALAAVAHRLLSGGSMSLAVITVVTFAASFAQAWSAGLGMTSHIPGAFLISLGALGAAVLAFTSHPQSGRPQTADRAGARP